MQGTDGERRSQELTSDICPLTSDLLQHLRHDEEMILRRRRVAHDFFGDIPIRDLIRALFHIDGNDRGHGLDTGNIEVSKLLHKAKNGIELAAKMFEVLAERRINLLAVSASEIKVTALIAESELELAVRVLHSAFGLDSKEAA